MHRNLCWNLWINSAVLIALFLVRVAVAEQLEMRIDLRMGFPQNAVLVRATATNSASSASSVTTTFRIEQIYFGPPELSSKEFIVVSPISLQSFMHEKAVFPPPAKGESGIWLLERKSDGKLTTKPSILYRLSLPARDPKDPSFKSAQTFAETVERVSRARISERIKLARELALSPAPELSTYAISILANSDLPDDEAAEYVHELLKNSNLSIIGQVTADEALCKIEKEKWRSSAQRVKLLQGWVTGKLAANDVHAVFSRLDAIGKSASEGGLTQDGLLALLQAALANDSISVPWRRQFVSIAQFAPDRYPDATPTFDWLITLIRENDDALVRRRAAHAIFWGYHLVDEERHATIVDLAKNEPDRDTKKLLEDATNHPKREDRFPMPPQSPMRPPPNTK